MMRSHGMLSIVIFMILDKVAAAKRAVEVKAEKRR